LKFESNAIEKSSAKKSHAIKQIKRGQIEHLQEEKAGARAILV